MIVEILCGGYGCPTKTGVHTVAHGERCEVSDAEAARLIGLGVAKCAFSAPTATETGRPRPRNPPLRTFRQLRKVTTPPQPKPRRTALRRHTSTPTSCTT